MEMAQYIPLNANDDLDAINDMLAAIGEPAVLQLDEGTLTSRTLNVYCIASIVRSKRKAGTLTSTKLLSAQYIPLNANDDLDAINDMLAAIGEPAVLQLDEGTLTSRTLNVYCIASIVRSKRKAGTLTSTKLLSKPFSEMPAIFRDYIVTKASREFNAKFFGSPESELYLREQEAELYQQVMEYEMDTGRYNMMSDIGRD
uniref:Phage tail fiber protein/T7-like tail tubular protein A n=1 Tax=Citrobacter phage NS1 TaxID=2766968 RepID=A0A7G9IRE9_9CAUD